MFTFVIPIRKFFVEDWFNSEIPDSEIFTETSFKVFDSFQKWWSIGLYGGLQMLIGPI